MHAPFVRALEVDNGLQGHLIDSSDAGERQPVLIPLVSAVRGEEKLLERSVIALDHVLVEQTSALKFHILGIVIGQEVYPDRAFFRRSPGEVLASRLLIPAGIVEHAEVVTFPVGPEIALLRASRMEGLVPSELLV